MLYGVDYSYLVELDRENSVVMTTAKERISHVADVPSVLMTDNVNTSVNCVGVLKMNGPFPW